ncbi:MAG: type I pullulanase [Flavobacteriaceae bacterium]|nr:type I pullulanase [Flavobacteriaceae bacterium]
MITFIATSCNEERKTYTSFDEYPVTKAENLWLDYTKDATTFRIWTPNATQVKVNLYEKGQGGELTASYNLSLIEDRVWSKKVTGDLHGTYYTYQIMIHDAWLNETPGIYAKAVGVNGQRAMVLDFNTTNPPNWQNDKGPELNYLNEAIIYELHIRDMTIHPQSGSSYPGTYLGLVEQGTKGPNGVSTAIDHLNELGITHVHLLPTYDHYSIDETKLDQPQFNWGYDPQNYNVPEGSFSSNPFEAEVRIKEFKQMVQAFHDHGIGVILDVVYNHTGITEGSNFNLENPGYYYRFNEDGSYSDAAACGNETSSDREMTRQFIIESVKYWAKEYHLDGFRFDLMGIHDITTMNEIVKAVKEVNPNVFIYGEGWTAGDSPLPEERRALKKHIVQMPQIAAFSDDIRDGLKGSVFNDNETGFVSGAKNTEESVKFGIVGSIQHPQIDYKAVNYSDAPWANEPWQALTYVSCHDNHTVFDKILVSRRDASLDDRIAMSKLANAVVMTSQGTAFMHAGAEMLRTKNEEHNSYKSPDSINQIDWNWKVDHKDVVDYYKNLIHLRKKHPAFRMPTADMVRNHLKFKTVKDGLISYQIRNNANSDPWKNIYIIYNAKTETENYDLDGIWKIAVLGDNFALEGKNKVSKSIEIPAISMAVLFQD